MTFDNAVTVGMGFTLGMLITFTIVGLIATLIGMLTPRDDTDSLATRSGMKVYTDYKTGAQYLSTPSGSLTPRLDSEGFQIINKDNAQ